jgi:hypothetical protein
MLSRCLLPALVLALAVGSSSLAALADDAPAADGATRVDLVFQGGHETNPRDHGRPVTLIAAALGVPTAVFREAFTHVHPAGPGEQPQEAQVRQNKQALMQRLAPYGVTDERLNEVSNYYRYRREAGEIWRHADAAGYAMVKNGKILRVTITNPGAGYTTPPTVSLPHVALSVYPMAVLAFGTDLATNGSIRAITQPPLGDHEVTRSTAFPQVQDVPRPVDPGGDGPPPPPPPPPQ